VLLLTLISAFFFHGEQLLVWFFALLGLLTLGLVWFTVWLVRRVKGKIGNRAYWLAPIPFVLVLLAVSAINRAQSPNNGPPTILPARKISALIKAQPDYAQFGYSGLASYKGKLYAATNLGLLEMEEGRLARVYRFQNTDSVVSGPWLDAANQLLWVLDDHTNQLLNYDGMVWHRVNLPKPQKGYYSRGDVLEGIKPTTSTKGFWLQASGSVWRWDSTKNTWVFENQRTSNLNSQDANTIIGVLPIGSKLLFIVRHQMLSFLVKHSEDFASDTVVMSDGDGSAIPNGSGVKFFAENWVVADETGYVRTRDGVVLKVTPQGITKLAVPGECETLAATESGSLLASFRSKGIYEYTAGWRLRAPHPYPSGNGEYWAHLSGHGKELAFAIDGKPVVDKEHSSGSEMKFIRNAPTALWYSQGTEFQRIDVP
jgi:hypothetical protein